MSREEGEMVALTSILVSRETERLSAFWSQQSISISLSYFDLLAVEALREHWEE